MEEHRYRLQTVSLLPDASDASVYPLNEEARELTTYEGSLLAAPSRLEWEPHSSRSGSSAPSSSSLRPIRRIACLTRSTEENEEEGSTSAESPERFLDGLTPETSAVSSGGAPLSLHGLSLSSGNSKKDDMSVGSEIRSRPPTGGGSELSAVQSVTYVSTTLEGYGPDAPVPVNLSKSSKKRWKRKQKKQQSGTQSISSPISVPIREPAVQDGWSNVVKDLLRENVPNVSLRYEEQGIQNLGSTCFLGSAMQFLLASSQFCWLMSVMSSAHHVLDKAKYPVVCAMGSLGTTLKLISTDMARSSERSRLRAISPDMLAPIVSRFRSRFNEPGSRSEQDVQEFLQFLLDEMDEEILHIRHACQQNGAASLEDKEEDNDDPWMIVGRKNKVSYRRTTGAKEASILSTVFGGYSQSEIRAAGMVPSVTTHCFITLILDIAHDHVHSIEEALDLYTTKDTIPGKLI